MYMFVRVRVCVLCALHVFLGLSCTDHGAEEVATCAATQWSQNTPNPHVFLQESGSADEELTLQRIVRVPRRVSLGTRLPRLRAPGQYS